ncbi:MAG: glycosyltransferase family 2 protein [Nitrososphaerota archaeon]|jgi:glycosyltransferase involved in cell wall biosynthesis|nr:glycosyltransferase family 2 protein [Nitrososphaerota archaeon]MDG6935881.1 glycosyltransferase family 2 protein [Nitrososphaerota archaeon]MDG6943491.1 glycosyltransferase family 2 protein [Nitrososphaerota archaeon]
MLISIEIPVTKGKYLKSIFESVVRQQFQEYEVIVVNSGPEYISKIINEYNFKEIRGNFRLLHARYLAHLKSNGEYTLILDETRSLGDGLLKALSLTLHDMVLMDEKEVGQSLLVRAAQLDKDNIVYCNSPDPLSGFALPRFFKSSILSDAFQELKKNLGGNFYEVIFPDHELIYYEASRLSRDVYRLTEPYIFHYGDTSIIEAIRKYYRYGKSIEALKGTVYENFLSMHRKKRKICKGNVGDRLLLYTLYFIRGSSFLLGHAIKRFGMNNQSKNLTQNDSAK